MNGWYYIRDGVTVGPVSEAGLRGLLATGYLAPTSQVRGEDEGAWLPAALAFTSTEPNLADTPGTAPLQPRPRTPRRTQGLVALAAAAVTLAVAALMTWLLAAKLMTPDPWEAANGARLVRLADEAAVLLQDGKPVQAQAKYAELFALVGSREIEDRKLRDRIAGARRGWSRANELALQTEARPPALAVFPVPQVAADPPEQAVLPEMFAPPPVPAPARPMLPAKPAGIRGAEVALDGPPVKPDGIRGAEVALDGPPADPAKMPPAPPKPAPPAAPPLPEGPPKWVGELGDVDPAVVRRAAEKLDAAGPAAMPELVRGLGSPSPRVRAGAAERLSVVATGPGAGAVQRDTVKAVDALLADPDAAVRSAAVRSLRKLGIDAVDAVSRRMAELLRDPDSGVRFETAAALRALARDDVAVADALRRHDERVAVQEELDRLRKAEAARRAEELARQEREAKARIAAAALKDYPGRIENLMAALAAVEAGFAEIDARLGAAGFVGDELWKRRAEAVARRTAILREAVAHLSQVAGNPDSTGVFEARLLRLRLAAALGRHLAEQVAAPGLGEAEILGTGAAPNAETAAALRETSEVFAEANLGMEEISGLLNSSARRLALAVDWEDADTHRMGLGWAWTVLAAARPAAMEPAAAERRRHLLVRAGQLFDDVAGRAAAPVIRREARLGLLLADRERGVLPNEAVAELAAMVPDKLLDLTSEGITAAVEAGEIDAVTLRAAWAFARVLGAGRQYRQAVSVTNFLIRVDAEAERRDRAVVAAIEAGEPAPTPFPGRLYTRWAAAVKLDLLQRWKAVPGALNVEKLEAEFDSETQRLVRLGLAAGKDLAGRFGPGRTVVPPLPVRPTQRPRSGPAESLLALMARAKVKSVVVVVDCTSSMNAAGDAAKIDALRLIGGLGPQQKFSAVWFGRNRTFRLQKSLVAATAANRWSLIDEVADVPNQGEDGCTAAVLAALQMNPDAVVVLTDAAVTPKDANLIGGRNTFKVPIHVVAYQTGAEDPNQLARLSRDSGGRFRTVELGRPGAL